MVASGLAFWKPATQAWVAACWVLAPAPEIVPETAGVPPVDADPPAGPVSLAAPQPARIRAPLAAMPTAASRVFTCRPPTASAGATRVTAPPSKLCRAGGRQAPKR